MGPRSSNSLDPAGLSWTMFRHPGRACSGWAIWTTGLLHERCESIKSPLVGWGIKRLKCFCPRLMFPLSPGNLCLLLLPRKRGTGMRDWFQAVHRCQVQKTDRRWGLCEVDMGIQEHCDVLVSSLQGDGERCAAVLKRKTMCQAGPAGCQSSLP